MADFILQLIIIILLVFMLYGIGDIAKDLEEIKEKIR